MYFYFAHANFCEKTSSFCFNADMSLVCDCCIPWKLFSPFHVFSRAVSFNISPFQTQLKAALNRIFHNP